MICALRNETLENYACARRTDIFFRSIEWLRCMSLTGQPEITRDDLKQMVAVTGRISGRDIGSVISQVKQVLIARALPQERLLQFGRTICRAAVRLCRSAAVFFGAVALVFLFCFSFMKAFVSPSLCS